MAVRGQVRQGKAEAALNVRTQLSRCGAGVVPGGGSRNGSADCSLKRAAGAGHAAGGGTTQPELQATALAAYPGRAGRNRWGHRGAIDPAATDDGF